MNMQNAYRTVAWFATGDNYYRLRGFKHVKEEAKSAVALRSARRAVPDIHPVG